MQNSDKQPPEPSNEGGMLVLDKPMEMSSMRAVTIVRHKVGMKVGHAGTLDPLATGVLVVGVGKATRSLDMFMKTTKSYHTIIDLSAFTVTDDREGDLQKIEVAAPPDRTRIDRLLRDRFTGQFMQRPPNFSAKKVEGRRAYKIARAGGEPVLEPREVVVHTIESLSYEWPMLHLAIDCAHGFYVRSLARDLGSELGTGGHCASIRRTAVGPFTIEEAVNPNDLPTPLPQNSLIPLQDAVDRLAIDR